MIRAGVSDGKLYILKIQVGDKRWFKGVDKEANGTANSFTIVSGRAQQRDSSSGGVWQMGWATRGHAA